MFEVPVTGGACKLQWKADWGMRWHALGVDYEMHGKDLIESARLSGEVCRILGSKPPVTCRVELFLDADGRKISKSLGNGMTFEQWMAYGPDWSLAHFLFHSPGSARRLNASLVPRAIDEHLSACERLVNGEGDVLANPAWHIHKGQTAGLPSSPIGFSMLLNLAEVSGATTESGIWTYIGACRPGLMAATEPTLATLVRHALAWRASNGETLIARLPADGERAALLDLAETLERLEMESPDAETVQWHVFEVGKRHGFEPLRTWFSTLYEVLLGKSEGQRFGHLAHISGLARTAALIREALDREPTPVAGATARIV